MIETELRDITINGEISPENIEDFSHTFKQISEIQFPDELDSQVVNLSESYEDTIFIKADEIPRGSMFSPDASFLIDPEESSEWTLRATFSPELLEEYVEIFDELLDILPESSLEITDLDLLWFADGEFGNLAIDLTLPEGFTPSGINVIRDEMSYIIQSPESESFEEEIVSLPTDVEESDEKYFIVYSSVIKAIFPESGTFISEQIETAEESIGALTPDD